MEFRNYSDFFGKAEILKDLYFSKFDDACSFVEKITNEEYSQTMEEINEKKYENIEIKKNFCGLVGRDECYGSVTSAIDHEDKIIVTFSVFCVDTDEVDKLLEKND